MTNDSISDLRKLLVLKTVVETGSFRSAARVLGITPSAVSQGLHGLEKKLGKAMLIRDNGAIRVTDDGLELLRQVAPAFAALEGLNKRPKELSIGRLDLGSYEALASELFPSMINQLRLDHPKAKLNLVTARSSVLLQKLRSGELCTAFIAESDDLNGLTTETVAEDELGII